MHSSASTPDTGRESEIRPGRRQLITSRSGNSPPPRVVLHLPDLDALQGIVLGPPQSTLRRIDAAHVGAEPYRWKSKSPAGDAKAAGETSGWLNLLRAPLAKLTAGGPAGTINRLGQLAVFLQQPKVLLAAVAAVGLQLAVVLSMLPGTGGSKEDTAGNKGRTPNGDQQVNLQAPAQIAGGPERTIQTPLNFQQGFGQGATPLPAAGPPLVAGPPSLPAPQTLSGADPRDVPAFPSPSVTPPVMKFAPAAATAGPSLVDATQPTIRPSVAISGNTPGNVVGNTPTGPVKARLMGTIRKPSTRETTP